MNFSFAHLQSRLWCILFLHVFLAFLLGLGQNVSAKDTWRAKVGYVLDGDTFYLKSGQKIRLKGIDAPEMPHENEPGQYFALKCRKRLAERIGNKIVSIEAKTLGADRFGRILAYVWLPGHRLLNKELVEEGLAFCFPHSKDKDDGYRKKLLQAQQRSMNSRRGFWARILSMPAAQNNYLGNKRSMCFHTLDCSYGKRISKWNKRMFSNLRQAFYAGYAPGRRCTPWPNN